MNDVNPDSYHVVTDSQIKRLCESDNNLMERRQAEMLLFYLEGNRPFIEASESIGRLQDGLGLCTVSSDETEAKALQAILFPKATTEFLDRIEAPAPGCPASKRFDTLLSCTTDDAIRRQLWIARLKLDAIDVPTAIQALSEWAKLRRNLARKIEFSYWEQCLSLIGDDAERRLKECSHPNDTSSFEAGEDFNCVLPRTAATCGKPILVPVATALDVLGRIVSNALNVHIEPDDVECPNRLDLRSEGRLLGSVYLDRPDAEPYPVSADGLPTSRALLRDDASGHLTFKSVRTLFHEVGHGIADCLSFPIALPIERSEWLSTWLEARLLTTDAAGELGISPDNGKAIPLLNDMRRKRALYMQSSTASALFDLHLHRSYNQDCPETILQKIMTAWPSLTTRPVLEWLRDFTHFHFIRHPGYGFVYPVAEMFAMIMPPSPSELRPAIDPKAKTDILALFRSYAATRASMV